MDHAGRKRRRTTSRAADQGRQHTPDGHTLVAGKGAHGYALHRTGARGYGHHPADGASDGMLIVGHHHDGWSEASHPFAHLHHAASRGPIAVHAAGHDDHRVPRSLDGGAGTAAPHSTTPGDHAVMHGYRDSSSSGLGGWVDPGEAPGAVHHRTMDGSYAQPGEHQRYGAAEGWSGATYRAPHHLAGQQHQQPPSGAILGHPYSASPYPQATSRWPSGAQGAWQSPQHFHEQSIAHHHQHQPPHQQNRVSPPIFNTPGNGYPSHPPSYDDEQSAHDSNAHQASRHVSTSSDEQASARGDDPHSQPRKGSKTGAAESARAPVVPSTMPGTKGFVACVSCRQRKIKCNGIRPQCTNCLGKNLPCSYDEVVKRRGPDKQPGARMRKREGRPLEDPKPARSIKGTARSGPDGARHVQGERPANPHGLDTSGHDFTFGATLQPGMAMGGMSMGMPPPRMHLGAFHSPANSPSVQTRHKFEGMSIDIPGHGQQYPRPQMLSSVGVIDPALSDPAPPAPPSLPAHGPAGMILPTTADSLNGHSWMHAGAGSEMSPLDVKPTMTGGFSPRMDLQDLLINGSVMVALPGQAAGRNAGRKVATIMPFTDSNEGSEGPITPPEISIHLERMPNIAYARDQDWVWMTSLLSDQRDQGMALLDTRLREVFDMGLSWFSCINRSAFFGALHHPVARLELQPALILSLLACSTLFRTGQHGPEDPGRQLACSYADAARSMIQQSIIGNKADPSLAQAALALCIFETCPHPQHSLDRTAGALKQMDSIMQTFCLFAIDVADERVSIFLPEQVPKLALDGRLQAIDQPVTPQLEGSIAFAGSQPNNVPTPWSPQPDWPVHWTEGDMRKDESRRVAWTASAIVATYSAWSQAMGRRPLDLYCAQPENYALFFPAEVLLLEDQLSNVPIGKRTVWALFHRLVLLWHFSIKNAYMGHDPVTRAGIAADILAEVDSIEQCLSSSSTQQLEQGNVYRWQSRDWILNIRRLMKYGYGAGANAEMDKIRGKQWLATQAQVAHMMANAMNGQSQSALPSVKNRPMYVWWLLGQAKTACDLYENDDSLDSAVELAAGLWRAIDMLIDRWPCDTAKAVALAFKARFDKILQHQSSLHVSPVSG